MGDTHKTRLSLNKFTELLSKNKYNLVTAYCEMNSESLYEARFFECKTPRYQKTFAVHVPSKYMLLIDDNSPVKRSMITLVDSPSAKQTEFMTELKGALLECDLLGISSTSVCLYKNNGIFEAYVFTDVLEQAQEKKDSPEDEDDIDHIKNLEDETASLIKKLTPDETTEEIIIDPAKDALSTEEGVGLIFEDEDGVDLEEKGPIRDMMVAAVNEDGGASTVSTIIVDTEISDVVPPSPIDEEVYLDNSIPSNLSDSEIALGAVYFIVELNAFFKGIEKYEVEIINVYSQLDENELDVKATKVVSIKDLLTKVGKHVEDKLTGLKDEELKIKQQLSRLTKILSQTDDIKKKAIEKLTEVGPEVDKIYNQTRGTVNELNVHLLKLRDDTDDILTTTETYLNEILEL